MSVLLYLNGNIYTMDAAQPRAQAMAIDETSGRILAVGSNDELRRAGGAHPAQIDLRGRTMLPGFIDAHIHLLSTAHRTHYIDAAECASEDEVAALVRQRAATTPAGHWIQGGRWDKNLWPGGNFPTHASLDDAAPEHPVALWSKDGHLLWVNSRALQRAGITRDTPNPPNGAILRDSEGEPTGVLQEEQATTLVYRVIKDEDESQTRVYVEQTLAEMQSYGITSIHEIEGRDALRLLTRLRDEGKLGVRVQMILPRQMVPQLRESGGKLHGFEGDDLLRVGGIKIFADGTLGSQTAAMLESFEGNPNNFGILTLPEEEMKATVSAAAEMGLSIAIHAIGDRAAHVALNSIEYAQHHLAETGVTGVTSATADPSIRNLRYRLEHVQLITPEDMERMRRLGVVASVQPFHAVADRDNAERYWGKRHRRAYAYHSMQQMGIPLALGSDAPVELFEPLRILYAATQRRSPYGPKRPPWLPDQALPVAEALRAYTLGAAYAGGEEHDKGSITVGKLGDAVILREDILNVPQEKMDQNGVQATLLGGKVVFGEV
ncbi:MAG TPA: amidohydrolase [Ktedonobacteraceae bacterium]|nr:amidohydrolase [Ktedonobacteraceae bacterium]